MNTEAPTTLTEADFTVKVTETARGTLNVRTATRGARTVRIMDREGHPRPWSSSPEEWAARNVALYEGGYMKMGQGVNSMEHALQVASEWLAA